MDVRSYFEVTKPQSVFLLVFTAFGAMIVASRSMSFNLPFGGWLSALVAITAGCAGSNAITCYIDRDLDSVMARTKRRPIPSGAINPPEMALYWGIFLIGIALILALMRNPLSFLTMLLGVLDNVVVYSSLLKRRSAINIILGGFSGGLPVLFGWVYVANSINLTVILIAAMVVLWIPNHIWNLAIYYREDYAKAKVPMLPVVVEPEKAIRCIVLTVILLVIFSIGLYFAGNFGLIYLLTAAGFGLLILIGNFYLFLHPTKEHAWKMFKFSSPYLFILFLAMIADVLLR